MRRFLILTSLLALACGSPTEPSGNATLNVRLTDTPFEEASAVLVTFDEISVHPADGDWMPVAFAGGVPTLTCNLKQLDGAQEIIGNAGLDAGRYTQIRLNVLSAVLYFGGAVVPPPACAGTIVADGEMAPLEISSGQVILNRPFDLVEDGATTITLDFDGDRSIIETAPDTYRMSPVITVLSVQ